MISPAGALQSSSMMRSGVTWKLFHAVEPIVYEDEHPNRDEVRVKQEP